MISSISKLILVVIIATLAIGVFTTPILASVMSSTNFKIQLDSINIGGGMGTSASFKMEDTVGEIGTGYGTSTNFKMHAGYQQMDQETYISLTVSDLVILAPSIGGLTGGTASGTGTVTVLTNNNAGYTLLISASTSPAMQHVSSSDTIANYTASGSDPDYDWAITDTDSAFGFSPYGLDVVSRYYNNGSACNQGSGSNSADKCWEAVLNTNMLISESNSANDPSGTDTQLKYRVESGASHMQTSGIYQAVITVTAYTN